MKVAVVAADTSSIPKFRIDMIDEFVSRGCEVVVFGDEPPSDWRDYFEGHGAGYRQWHVSRRSRNPLSDIAAERDLEGQLREEAPDKVFTYHAKANIYGTVAARRASVPESYAMVGGLGSAFNDSGAKADALRAVVTAEYAHALRDATRVFFQNADDAARFESLGIVRHAQIAFTRGSGVNLYQYPFRQLPESPAFLFVGRLVRAKGIVEFMEAARMVKARYPHARFDVVGPFDSNSACISEEELSSYVADGVIDYHGPQVVMGPFYEKCSCFVLPSYYGEGTPKSALEAMSTGRPLIMADAVGSREVVRKGANGFLVPPRDPVSVAAAMELLIEDRGLALKMARESRALAEDVFDVGKVNETICLAMGL